MTSGNGGKLRIGYVPEHFSSPLLILSETEWGRENLELISQPSGTGQMLTSLDSNQDKGQIIDVAVALTESLIAAKAKENGRKDYKLVGSYVRSSLNWAVITGTSEKAKRYQSIDDLKDSKIGISRIGSGSQIMASYMALKHGWTSSSGQVSQVEFQVNHTFKNLRDSVNGVGDSPQTGAFMWEWFTTKPYQDSGEIRFIGSVPTPWPSWSIAASDSTVLSNPSKSGILKDFLSKLDSEIKKFSSPDSISDGSSANYIIKLLNYKAEDVHTWLNGVRWCGDSRSNDGLLKASESNPAICPPPKTGQNTSTQTVSRETLEITLDTLEKAGVCQKPEGGWKLEEIVENGALVD